MTSRESSASIPDRLAQMKIAFPNPDAADVILATNMISVGVDIDRLGLMAIMGQPQSTAEYIQASSRVGRRHPGLVVTLFNSARSRDRSHYESFRPYHSALYRQVEATSVTPFSARARDRGIEAVLVALVRLNISGLRANDSAGKIADYLDEVRVFRDRIVARARQVSEGREAEATREQLDGFIGRWLERAERQPGLVYTAPFQLERALLVDAASEREDEFSVSALRSLRDVDQTSNLFLVRV
jgi:superfamily II DNA or RNA helicase